MSGHNIAHKSKNSQPASVASWKRAILPILDKANDNHDTPVVNAMLELWARRCMPTSASGGAVSDG